MLEDSLAVDADVCVLEGTVSSTNLLEASNARLDQVLGDTETGDGPLNG